MRHRSIVIVSIAVAAAFVVGLILLPHKDEDPTHYKATPYVEIHSSTMAVEPSTQQGPPTTCPLRPLSDEQIRRLIENIPSFGKRSVTGRTSVANQRRLARPIRSAGIGV